MDTYEQLKRDEGEILHAYQDHLGFWTIGIGILIDKRGMTEEAAYQLLRTTAMERGQRIGEVARNLIDASKLLG